MSINITLERDGHDQPWGFRLQGGVDVGLPLSVLRVLVGTPAESVFKKGDLVTTISQTETRGLTHQQAVDLFNHAGNQINVVVKRPGVGGVAPTSNQPTISTLQLSAANKQQQQQQQTLAGLAQQTGEKTETQEGLVNAASDHQRSAARSPLPGALLPGASLPGAPIAGPLAAPLTVAAAPASVAAPAPVPAKYNTAAGLHANQEAGVLAPKPNPGPCLINPVNKPLKPHGFFGSLSKKYDPELSATWQIIHAQENCQLITEHGPTESKVYSI